MFYKSNTQKLAEMKAAKTSEFQQKLPYFWTAKFQVTNESGSVSSKIDKNVKLNKSLVVEFVCLRNLDKYDRQKFVKLHIFIEF